VTGINQYLIAYPYLRPSWCFKVVYDCFCPEIINEIITCTNVTRKRKIAVAVTADPLQRLTIYSYPSPKLPQLAITFKVGIFKISKTFKFYILHSRNVKIYY
jgi:hypothetical protein